MRNQRFILKIGNYLAFAKIITISVPNNDLSHHNDASFLNDFNVNDTLSQNIDDVSLLIDHNNDDILFTATLNGSECFDLTNYISDEINTLPLLASPTSQTGDLNSKTVNRSPVKRRLVDSESKNAYEKKTNVTISKNSESLPSATKRKRPKIVSKAFIDTDSDSESEEEDLRVKPTVQKADNDPVWNPITTKSTAKKKINSTKSIVETKKVSQAQSTENKAKVRLSTLLQKN